MADDSSQGIVERLKRILRGSFLAHIPDHPAHGGNTGDAEWTPEDAKAASEASREESPEPSNTTSEAATDEPSEDAAERTR